MAGNRQEFTYAINADTSKAKKQIADLFKSLDNVQKYSLDNFNIAPDLVKASHAAEELAGHLRMATNVNTGQLDLAKFNQSIRNSNTSLTELISNLGQGGSAGQAAFEQMTAAIARTQVPLRQTSALLKDMATTLKNTIKWELSSTAVHGLESALSGAVSYAKNLNTSLTNIRIVTGQSVEDMARFTKEANAAAKALSTTTKSYADASLIYYQQGDSQEMAAKKAAITIKAANASFETSAKEMSEYLTAVWNSYQVGADELERYVDIMANLGAKTATSLEEIATSMQKVAATSNTVGVSMEQVSSIIATVSSVTRESAESIGTSYKTIFARIGDLKLGKADEDGVGLGQVSSQLDAIGVKILDESGNLREMGDIIMDLGTKWQTMNQAQKTAVAQVVAGKRQYTQLMALFENWDMFQANLNLAENSEGALQDMADIYAESWEAASARVQASMESIFSSLINDQGLIKLTNFTADFVDGIGGAIESIGGLNGVLRLTGSLMMKSFGKEAGARIKEIGTSMKNFFIGPKAQYEQASKEIRSELISGDYNTAQVNAQLDLFDAKQKVLEVEKYLSSAQKETAQNAITALGEQANKIKELEDEYNNLYKTQQQLTLTHKELNNADLQKRFNTSKLASMKFDTSMKQPQMQNINEVFNTLQKFKSLNILGQLGYDQLESKNFEPLDEKLKLAKTKEKAIELQTAMEKLGVTLNGITAENLEEILRADKYNPEHVKKLQQAFSQLAMTTDDDIDKINNALEQMIQKMQRSSNEATQAIGNKLAQAFQEAQNEGTEMGEALIRVFQELGIEIRRSKDMKHNIENMFGDLSFEKITSRIFDLGGGILDLLNSTEAISASIVSWGDDSVTTAQKLGQLTSATLELASGAASLFSAFGGGWAGGIAAAIGVIATLGAGIISGNEQKDIDEARAKQEKYRKSGFKVSESTREEIQANQDLLSSYNSLLSIYDQTKENQAELIESAYALAEAYEIVGGKALIAAGEYGEFNKQLLQAQKAQAAKNVSDFDKSMYEIESSVNENKGGYYDIQSQKLYDGFEKDFQKILTTEQKITYGLESQGLKLNGAKWDNVKMNGRGRASQVFDDLYSTFMSEEFQAVINPNGEQQAERAAMAAIEEFIRVNKNSKFEFTTGKNSFHFTDNKLNGLDDFRQQFIGQMGESDLKISTAYDAYTRAGIVTEDIITKFLNAEDLGITEGILDPKYLDQFDGLIDHTTGGISWNKLDFEGKLNQYQKYRDEVVPAIKKKQSEVQAEMAKQDKDSDAYKALAEYYEYLNTALNDLELITGADSEIGKTFELYLSDKKARDIERAKVNNIESFLKDDNGQYRTSKNTTLSDFMAERVALEENLLKDAETYDTLAPYVENGQIIEKYKKEYQAAVNEIIAGMVQGTDLTNLFDIDNIIKESVKSENQTDVTALLVEKGIETADEVSGLLLQVISGTWDESAKLLAGSIIDANKQETKANQAVAEYEQFAAAGKLFKSGMSSQDRTEFSNVFFNGETSKEEIDSFIKMSFEEREAYIEKIIKAKERNMISELEAAANADKAVFEAAETRSENARLELGLESGEIDTLLAGYTWNDDKKGYYSTTNPQEAYNGKLADRQDELHEYENYVSQMKTAEQESILSYGEWQMAKIAIEDTLSVMEKLQNQQSKLAVDLSDLPKQGTAAWRRLRTEILKTGQDLNNLSSSQQIEAISQAQIDNLDAQIKAKRLEYFDTDSEVKRAEISQAIADLQDQKDQIAIEVEAAYASLNDKTTAGIAAEWERANQKAQEQQEIARILSSSVESGIISNEEAVIVGITADEWARYSVEVRAAKAASAALQGSSAMEQTLKNEQKAVDGAITYLEKYETSIKNTFADGRLEELLSGSFEAGTIDASSLKQFREVYNEIIAAFGKDISSDKLIEEMSIRLGIDSKDLESQIKQVAGSGKDAVNDIFSTMSRELQEKAQDAVDAWQEAFDKIAAAREKLASGGSLLEDIAGDPEALIFYAQQLGMSVEEAYNKIVSGMIDESQLKMPKFDLENAKAIYGLDKGIGQSRSQDAVALGYEESDIGTDAFQSKVIPYYQKILMASGKYTEEAALELATSIARGTESYDLITEGASHLAAALPLAAEAAETFAQRNIDAANVEKAAEIDQQKYDNQTELQAALEEARDVKKENGDWEDISSENRSILEANGIIGLNQVDAAAIECASALAQLAQAAYEAAKKEAEDAGYTQNEDGAWGIQHTLTEEQGRLDYGSDWDQYKTTLTQNEDGTYNQGFEVIKEINDPLQEAEKRVRNLKGELEDLPTDLWDEEMESFGLDPDEVDELGDNIQKMAKSSDELANSLENDADAADEVAKELSRFDKAVESITDNYKEWDKALKSDNIQKQNKAIKEMDKAFSDMLDIDYDSLSDDFLQNAENLELMKKAAEGSEDAYKELQARAEDSILIKAGVQIEDAQLWDTINSLQDQIHNGIDDIQVGAYIDNSQAIQAMNELINAAGLTADQATNLLASMGVDAEVETISIPEEQKQAFIDAVPQISYETVSTPTVLNGEVTPGTTQVPTIKYSPVVSEETATGQSMTTALRVTSAKKSSGGGFKMKNSTASGGGKKSGGGGGSKSKNIKEKARGRDNIERYHKNNDTIDRLASQLEKIDKLKDRAYGKDHITQLNAETEALNKQLVAQQALHDEALKWMAADKADLQQYGAVFDENGTISNYEQVMENILDEYNAAVEAWNNSGQGEGDEAAFEAAEQRFEDAKKAIDNYEEALSNANDSANEMLEIQNQLSELEVEKVTYELELKLNMNERDLELLGYYQNKYENDLEKQDELFNTFIQSALEYENNLVSLGQAYEELNAKYAAGLINKEDYAKAIGDLEGQIVDNLSSLQNIQKELVDVYANTLSQAREEVEKTTDSIESSNNALRAYMDIIKLSGNGNEYQKVSAFYEQINTNNLLKITTQRSHLDALLEEEDRFQEKIRSGQELTDLEKEQYKALREEIQDTRDALLNSTTEALETIRETYENTINGIADDLDKFMAGASGSMAHLQEQYAYFQEEQGRYVSTAKELYEVSKLNRDIEGSLATATSSASKEALKALQEKINKQSELNELTEYDIEMNQLQYQLLLARIKLEEAQNSKDTVRLTRDENGNYAYRYTANQDKIDEAAQHYEDVLQQINDTTVQRTSEIEQQLLNTMSNYKEKFQEIATDYSLTEEERLMKLKELNNQFSESMKYLQEQNNIATSYLTANQEAIAGRYGTTMSEITSSTAGNVNNTIQSMIKKTEEYVAAMNNAIFGEDGAQSAWQKYLAQLGDIEGSADVAYETLLQDSKEMGEMNEYAADEALKVIQTLRDTLDPLASLSSAWEAHNAILEATISNYENLAQVIQGVLSAIGEIPNGGSTNVDGAHKYAKGGLVDYTGLAWVDGTASDPEMMLNPGDTQNILKATAMVKSLDSGFIGSLVESVKSAAQAMLHMFGGAYHAINNIHTATNEALDQNVHITAEFPNVQNHTEIEEAFENLINQAAQFAHRKN